MTLPSSPTWSLLDLNAANITSVTSLSPSDATLTPGGAFTFPDDTTLRIESADGTTAVFDFTTPVPSRFTLDLVAKIPKMPSSVADLADHRITIEVADDAGRGVALHLSASGISVSRIDDFGSAVLLPDTAADVQEAADGPTTLRVAVDSALGRAYVFLGEGNTERPALRYILPAEATPVTVGDRLRLTVLGTADEQSRIEVKQLRLAPDIVMANPPPTANAGPDRVAPLGQAVRFDGRASFDLEGARISYRWYVESVPLGSQYMKQISGAYTEDDGDADGVTSIIRFAPGALPAWAAAGDRVRVQGISYPIAMVDNGFGYIEITTESLLDSLSDLVIEVVDQSFLVGPTTETPYGVPDITGIYAVALVVNDGESDSEPSEVIANIVASRAPFGVEPDMSVMWKALGDEWKYIDGREVFESAWKGAAMLLAGKLLEVWQHHYNFSIRDAQRVLQRKWIPYRTLVAETAPESVEVLARYGAFTAGFEFENGAPVTPGTVLVIRYATSTGLITATITLSAVTVLGLVTEINTALMGTGVEAYGYGLWKEDDAVSFRSTATTTDDGDADGFTSRIDVSGSIPSWVASGDTIAFNGQRYVVASVNIPLSQVTIAEEVSDILSGPVALYRTCRLGIRGTRGFRIEDCSAAAELEFETGAWNYPHGTGALATARSYIVYGVDLSKAGVVPGDLLVVNNGESFTIDRLLTDPLDPVNTTRVLVREDLPADTGDTWAIPSIVRGAEVDYELRGAYPGDLVKFEVYDTTANSHDDVSALVIAQKSGDIAVDLRLLSIPLLDTARFDLRMLGVKRRKAVEIYADTVSIPRLQDLILASLNPTVLQENVDYVLEPFYRDGDAQTPMLQFRDEVYILPDVEPPDILWAELTVFSNDPQIEALFGTLAGFTRDDASNFSPDFNYLAGVSGLLYSRKRGPHVEAIRIGAQILFGQPFAEVDGVITEIDPTFSTGRGRILIRDSDETRSEVLRSYYYQKDPLDLSATSGLDINPSTELPWAAGDTVPQFSPLGSGVSILDLYNSPDWYLPFVRSGQMSELEKFHTFAVKYNVDLVSLANLSLLAGFISTASPKHTHPILLASKALSDDIDVTDSMSGVIQMNQVDSTHSSGSAFTYDDYRGDGTLWNYFDDGGFFDSIVDCPTDIIVFTLTVNWPGGALAFDGPFFFDTDAIDVDGTLGPPGGTISLTYDMTLPAGTYVVEVTVKSGGIVLP